MLAAQRQRLILDRLGRDGAVAIADLVREWQISRETARRDIAALAARGLLQQTRGGAVTGALREPDESARAAINVAGKRAVGMAAAALVPDGAIVLLDSGTTTRAVAEALAPRRGLTVHTNDLTIARRLARSGDNRVILLGGEIQPHEDATGGLDAIEMLGRYTTDFAFVGAGAISDDGQLTDYSREAAELRGRMIRAARAAAIVADHTKFGRATAVRVVEFARARWLVTDRPPARAIARAVAEQGVEIVVAPRVG